MALVVGIVGNHSQRVGSSSCVSCDKFCGTIRFNHRREDVRTLDSSNLEILAGSLVSIGRVDHLLSSSVSLSCRANVHAFKLSSMSFGHSCWRTVGLQVAFFEPVHHFRPLYPTSVQRCLLMSQPAEHKQQCLSSIHLVAFH